MVSKWEENLETPTPARRSENRGNEGKRGRAQMQEFKQSQAVYQYRIMRLKGKQWLRIIPLMVDRRKV